MKFSKLFRERESIILLTFMVTFFIAMIYPTFISTHVMYIPNFVTAWDFLGVDLYDAIIIVKNKSGSYSPLSDYLFLVISKLPHKVTYRLFLLFSLSSITIICFYLLPRISSNYSLNISLIFFILLVSSYGFMFELERGQWNIITFLFIYLSLLFFKRNNVFFSILFITIAIQLKIYPAIFIIMFYKSNLSVKENILFILKLGIINLLLLFSRGWNHFLWYINEIFIYSNDPFCWAGNHSISSFASELSKKSIYLPFLPYVLFILYIICLSIISYLSYKKRMPFYNKYMFFMLTIGSLIIPSVSHDYKLPALGIATLYFLSNTESVFNIKKGFIYLLLLFTIFLTFYSYTNYIGRFNLLILKNKFLLIYFSGIVNTFLCFDEYYNIKKTNYCPNELRNDVS